MIEDDDPETVQDDEKGSLEDRETISRSSPRLHQDLIASGGHGEGQAGVGFPGSRGRSAGRA